MENLNKLMSRQIDDLSETMIKQLNTYKEISSIYKGLNQNEIAAPIDSLYLIFSKLNSSYAQIQKILSEVLKPIEKHFYYELLNLETRLQEVKTFYESLSVVEKKLREKKNSLFLQQDIKKWELSNDCSIPMDLLYTNKVIAFKEMLPKDTSECNKHRMMYGYLCNKAKEEFKRINIKNKDWLSVSLLFSSKVNLNATKDVCSMWESISTKYADSKF